MSAGADSSNTAFEAALAEVLQSPQPSQQALARLVPLVYDELRRMAHVQLVREGRALTLNTTALVHEAYLKLVDGRAPVKSRAYFFGAAARAMRQVLVDAARRRGRKKRGGDVQHVELDENRVGVDATAGQILELDQALQRLEREHARPARVLECRFFGGLSVEETADVLEVAPRTVDRDWTFARAWVRRELSSGGEDGALG